MPKVSVIIPVYKSEKYIERCIRSIQEQSLQDFEIILVDDCGGDGSMTIAEDLASKDGRIKIIHHERNMGPMEARYNGVMASVGQYITFCDSDDTLPDNALENLYNQIERTNSDIVSGTMQYISVDGKRHLYNNTLSFGNDNVSVFKSLLKREFVHNLCGKLFCGDLLRNNSFSHFENFINGEDAIYFYEIVDKCNYITTISNITYYYCQNEYSSSQTRLSDSRVRNVIEANIQNYNICIKYPELKQLTKRACSISINNWYISGYNSCGLIDEILREYNMQFLSNPFCMISFLPPALYIKIITKRFLLHSFYKK